MKKVIRTSEALETFLYSMASDVGWNVDLVAMDIETANSFGKEAWIPEQLELAGIGIYAGEDFQAFIIHSDELDYSSLDLLAHNRPVVFHNAKFDLAILERYKILSEIDSIELHDTMLMSFIQDEEKFSHGLKSLTEEYLKVPKDEITKFTDIGERPKQKSSGQLDLFDGANDEKSDEYKKMVDDWYDKIGTYCIEDCKHTYDLFYLLKDLILKEDESLWKLYRELEVPFMLVLKDMETRGITIDKAYLKKMSEVVEDRLLDVGANIFKEAGKEIDINSPKQVGELLFDVKGYAMPDEFKTQGGKRSVDNAALEYIIKTYKSDLAKFILEYRELSKLQSTYIKAIPELSVNDVVHCSFNQAGARTGRLSSSNPNLQNIPTRDDEFNIRKAFVPRKGYVFVNADYSQIELRVMAFFSKDKTLLEAYQNGRDIHQETADKLGCSRSQAKCVNFGLLYGQTAYGLSGGMGLSVPEAQKFITSYFNNFPGVKAFIDKAIDMVKTKRFTQTLLKRRRRFDSYNRLPVPKGRKYDEMTQAEKQALQREKDRNNKAIERMAVNSTIQGSASDIIKVAMRNMSKKLKEYDAHLVLQIHDEVLVECPVANAAKVSEIIQNEMQGAVELPGVPLVSEPKICKCWEK